jgi:hypothetical protein
MTPPPTYHHHVHWANFTFTLSASVKHNTCITRFRSCISIMSHINLLHNDPLQENWWYLIWASWVITGWNVPQSSLSGNFHYVQSKPKLQQNSPSGSETQRLYGHTATTYPYYIYFIYIFPRMHNPVYTFTEESMQMDPQTQPSHNSSILCTHEKDANKQGKFLNIQHLWY